MLSPEELELQMEICSLKCILDEIKDELVAQHSALPALASENEQMNREIMTELRVARSLNIETERLKLENVKLTAKRMELKQRCDVLTKSVDCARSNRSEIVESLNQEEQEMEQQIRNYEDSLQKISDRFRKTHGYYNEEKMVAEISKVKNRNVELEGELLSRQSVVDKLRQQFKEIKPDVPDEFLTMIGKLQLDEKVKSLTDKYEALKEKINLLKYETSDEGKLSE